MFDTSGNEGIEDRVDLEKVDQVGDFLECSHLQVQYFPEVDVDNRPLLFVASVTIHGAGVELLHDCVLIGKHPRDIIAEPSFMLLQGGVRTLIIVLIRAQVAQRVIVFVEGPLRHREVLLIDPFSEAFDQFDLCGLQRCD